MAYFDQTFLDNINSAVSNASGAINQAQNGSQQRIDFSGLNNTFYQHELALRNLLWAVQSQMLVIIEMQKRIEELETLEKITTDVNSEHFNVHCSYRGL